MKICFNQRQSNFRNTNEDNEMNPLKLDQILTHDIVLYLDHLTVHPNLAQPMHTRRDQTNAENPLGKSILVNTD